MRFLLKDSRERESKNKNIRYLRKGGAIVERFFFGVFVGSRIGGRIAQVRQVFVFVGHGARRRVRVSIALWWDGLAGG